MAKSSSSSAPLFRKSQLSRQAIFVTFVAAVVLQSASLWLIASTTLSPTGVASEVLIWAPAALFFGYSVRAPARLMLAFGIPMLLVAMAHAIKIRMMSLPVMASDFTSLPLLLEVLPNGQVALFALGAAALTLVWLWSIAPSDGAIGWTGCAIIYIAMMAYPIAALNGFAAFAMQRTSMISPADSLRSNGPTASVLYDLANRRSQELSPPSLAEVLAALGNRPPAHAAGNDLKARSIHLVLLESVWDLTALGAYSFSSDPFDPRFRKWLKEGGSSHVLSPVFGGATANAEFEALCGLPATRDAVSFMGLVKNPAPCLPRILRDAGYSTVAIHPFTATYWNRDKAYPLIGFERYRPIDAFALDDMDGSFLSDSSMFKQILQIEHTQDHRPRFEYIVSLSSHYPFDRNTKLRPDVIKASPSHSELSSAANAIRYTTQAFADFTEAVLARDPDAIVVGFGDHAPVLANESDPYEKSGLSRRPPFKHLSWTPELSRTPLVVIDGTRGSRPFGEIPLHLLPSRLLELLGPNAPRMPHSLPPGPERDRIANTRMFLGSLMVRGDDGTWRICTRNMSICEQAARDRDNLRVIRDDLFAGHQYTLEALSAKNFKSELAMVSEGEFGSCGLTVSNWGPQFGEVGQPLNSDVPGKSVIWMQIAEGRGSPNLFVGDTKSAVTISNKLASASFNDAPFLYAEGTYPVYWSCPDGSQAKLGRLTIKGAAASASSQTASAPNASSDCSASITNLGPSEIIAGLRFNVQPSGHSAFWLSLRPGSKGNLSVAIDGIRVSAIRDGDMMSFLIEGELVQHLREPGTKTLQLMCDGQTLESHRIQVRAPK